MTDDVHALHKAVTAIMRALKIAETQIRVAHRDLDVVPADIQTMRFVSQHAGCMLSELASDLGVVPATASSVVDRPVDRGPLQRERPDNNRRAVSLYLTEEGSRRSVASMTKSSRQCASCSTHSPKTNAPASFAR